MSFKSKFAVALMAIPFCGIATNTTDGVKIEHLGTNNTLVRIDSVANYLLMPVQESNDDATVNVVIDGKLDRTIYVRLAKSKVDYSVPFDLTPYKGHDVVLNIVTSQNRSTVREAKRMPAGITSSLPMF